MKAKSCCVRVACSADRNVVLPLHLGHSPIHIVVSVLSRDLIRGGLVLIGDQRGIAYP